MLREYHMVGIYVRGGEPGLESRASGISYKWLPILNIIAHIQNVHCEQYLRKCLIYHLPLAELPGVYRACSEIPGDLIILH